MARLGSGTRVRSDLFHFLENVLSLSNLSEDGVLSIEMRSRNEAEEELRSVGVGTSVGHGEDTGTVMLVNEVLIGELSSVDGFTSGTVSNSEISTLCHEARDDSVPDAALEVEGLSRFTDSLLSSAESSEVIGGLGGVSGKFHNDTASGLSSNGDVEEN